MDRLFLLRSLIFIFLFIFMGYLLISIFMIFIIFKFITLHEIQIYIHVNFMVTQIDIYGNSWICVSNSCELYEPWPTLSCMNCNVRKIPKFRSNVVLMKFSQLIFFSKCPTVLWTRVIVCPICPFVFFFH